MRAGRRPERVSEMGSLRRLLAAVALALGGAGAALLIAELLLRLFGIYYPPGGAFFVPDRYTGWGNRAGAEGASDVECPSHVRINSDGLRDREHSSAKPPGVLRVAVLGDSFTEALQVPMERDFCSVLERRLGGCEALRDLRPEVINFGVSGYGTAQELITLQRKVWKYSPDVVVLAYFPGNDLYDNARDLQDFDPGEAPGPRPFFYYDGGGTLALDNSFRSSPRLLATPDRILYGSTFLKFLWRLRTWQVLNRLRSVGAVQSLFGVARALRLAWSSGKLFPDIFARGEVLDRRVLNPPADARWREAWRVTEGIITEMHREVANHGARFLLVVLSEELQVYPGERGRARLLRKAGVADPLYPNRRLEALARTDGFGFLSCTEPLQRYADQHHAFVHGCSEHSLGHGHWNALGHELAGSLIAAKVCEMLRQPAMGSTKRALP